MSTDPTPTSGEGRTARSALLAEPAALVLEDGTVHRGHAYGARGETLG